jgi:hypothetical protein
MTIFSLFAQFNTGSALFIPSDFIYEELTMQMF